MQDTLVNLDPNEYSQEFHFYPFVVKLDRCVEGCNTLNDLSNKLCVPNKTEDLNLSVFNMITWIKESKTLTKYITCKCKCELNARKFNLNQCWNNDKCRCYGWFSDYAWWSYSHTIKKHKLFQETLMKKM